MIMNPEVIIKIKREGHVELYTENGEQSPLGVCLMTIAMAALANKDIEQQVIDFATAIYLKEKERLVVYEKRGG
jgi:hypothetical protein